MRFSNDGVTYAAAVPFATTANWTLLSGDGTKTVYAQFQDQAGNWSAAVSDTISLDTTAPAISAVATGNYTGSSVTITWTTNEPATSQVDYGTGAPPNYASTTALDPALSTSHSVTLSGLAPDSLYNYRVR